MKFQREQGRGLVEPRDQDAAGVRLFSVPSASALKRGLRR